MSEAGPSRGPLLSVVIAAYNERATIEEVLLRVQAAPFDKEIIVVDDGSTDGTREVLAAVAEAGRSGRATVTLPRTGIPLRTAGVVVLLQERNRGKGAALRRGFQVARGRIVLVQDADLEYSPEDYGPLLEPIRRGVADVVYGSRFLGGPHRVLLYWHSAGNTVLTTLSNMLTNLNLTDVWTGFKAFRREVLDTLTLREEGFGFEPEVTAKVARGGWRVYEVPIGYWGRTYAEGKKITWRDGLRALWLIVRYNLGR